MTDQPSRREFLGQATAAAGITAGAASAHEADSVDAETKYQPESFWKDRITAPDDGKMLGWLVDTRRCFGCHDCEVSCKSENDVPLGHFIRQTVYKDIGEYPQVARVFLPRPASIAKTRPVSKPVRAVPCTKKSAAR